ncbi:MAG: SusC/RagA family TonB-linked outer membrane protein [Flavobacteriales bacterium]
MKKTDILLAFFILSSISLYAQQKTITGTVTDEKGLPLPGVNIVVVGTSPPRGTATDFDGRYSLAVNTGEKLRFTYISYEDFVLTVGGKRILNISMVPAKNQLNELVVTAFGIKREQKALGYGVSEVSADDIEKSGEQNVVEALAAKAAGVQVIGSGGTPGASSKIIIRGKKSIMLGSDPLIIVDGVRVDNATVQSRAGDHPFNKNLEGVNASNRLLDLNSDDIENVSVLKGPAAAALYGEGAGNGVIIYTTKRGKKRKGIGIDFRTSTEFSTVDKLPKLQHTYAAGTGGQFIAPADPGPDKLYDTGDDVADGTPISWGPKAAEAGIPLYDNTDHFFQTGVTQSYDLALVGGSEKSSFRLSLGRTEQEGIIPNSELKRTSIRLTGDTDLSDDLRMGATATYSYTGGTKVQNGSNISGIMLGLLRAPASYDIRDYIDGETGLQKTYYKIYDNPYYTAYKNPFTDEVNRTLGSAYITYMPKDWFHTTLRSGWDVYSDNRRQVYAISSMGDQQTRKGQVSYDRILNKEFNVNLIFSGTVPLIRADILNLNYTTGLDINASFYDEVFSRGRNLAAQGIYSLRNASDLYASSSKNKKIDRGIYTQVEFDVKDQLFLTLSGREDEASTYNKKPFYPAASLAWVASSSLDLPTWVNFVKLRYGYSESGLSPQPYKNKTFYLAPSITDGFTDGLSFPYLKRAGLSISNVLGDPDLKPERLLGHEAGLELAFLQKRITLNASYYYQTSKDVLLGIPLARSTGFAMQYTNAAEVVNKGFEVDLGLDMLHNRDWEWHIQTNFATNDNEVIQLADNVKEASMESAFQSIGSYAIVGNPLGAFFGTRWKRDGNGNLVIGANGLPLKEPKTGGVGNPAPQWTAGIRNTLSWKNLTLSALLDIRKGGDVWNGTYARLNRYGATAESATDRGKSYIIPGVKADGSPNDKAIDAQTYFSKYLGDGGGAAEQFVQDGGWVRLRDVSLAYRVSDFSQSHMLHFIQYVEFSVSGRNLWLDTQYKGVDPETSLTGAGSNIDGFDYFNNPGSKSFAFGLKVGF